MLDIQSLTGPLISLAIAAAAFGIGVWFTRRKVSSDPLIAQLEAALMPHAISAVIEAYRIAERAFTDVGHAMDGADKKAFADSLYRMLPDRIGDFEITFVKSIVTPERWAQIVQDAYDTGRASAMYHKEHIDGLYVEWLAENQVTE